MERTKTTKFLGSFSLSKNGGGAGGTTNYDNLTNKPKVNGIVLSGNKTSADLGITTLTPFPSTWPTAGKFEDLLAAIRVDTIAVKGASFLGEVTFDDLPANLGNAEIKVEILEGTTSATKVIHSVITSGNREPYRWEYTSWNSGNSNSGWISFQLPLTAGDGISIENNVISITGGNVYTQSNLLGGKSIEIVDEPVEGGIDQYTLSCFHLDGTAVDEVTGYTLSPTMDNSVHKFGTGSSMWTNSTNFPWSLNSYKSFSFDYWYYHKTSRSSYLGLTKTAYYTYLLGLYFGSGATKPKFCVIQNKYDIDVTFESNKWTHVYVYYNAEDRSFHLFVNGKEVFSVIDSTDFSGVKEFANDGYTESRFDEIRISKCIRWTEDFEPPTEPYSVAVPTGNKVINNTGVTSINTKKGNVTLTADDINVTYTHEGTETTTSIKEFADTIDHSIENINSLIPVNAYTAENLIAGKNITIEEVLPEGGIDNHTKGCWHFDGNNENAATVGLMNITTGSISQYFEDGKFGKCARLAQNAVQTGWAPATVSADYSYDYWLLCTRALNTRICGMGSSTTENGKFYVLSSGKVASYIGGDPDVSKNPAVDMPLNTWMHLAYCKKDGIGHWFVNGKLIDKRADPGYLATMQISAEASNTSYKFDELRISDIARWTEDFEPPTQPYSLAVPTGKTAINNAITKTSQLTNDSGFITSVPVATTTIVGGVKPDGTTITVTEDGTISAIGGSSPSVDLTGYYNRDNLLGSDEIEIVPEPVEGGIDEHTLALWHCDNDLVDSIGGSMVLRGSQSTTYKKFGDAGMIANDSSSQTYTPITSLSLNANTSIFTIDYWIYLLSSITNNSTVGVIGADLTFKNSRIASNGGKFATSFSKDLETQRWYHVGEVYDAVNDIIDVYLDGKKIASSAINKSGYSDFSAFSTWAMTGYFYLDEIRISDVRRYSEDFTPPTKAYSVAVPTGNYVVRNKTELVHKSDIGVANGVVGLDADAKIPSALLPSSAVTSDNITKIVKLTQAEYDQLETKDDSTFYAIVG